ncbi:NUDIX hydrolase [Candidatus Saccharibacteria bacterium]|nr:MAG: NUDIX hydrolase [Candidatus Saccharibacteria bacterium]
MSIPLQTLRDLQSPFYRVGVKAMVFDDVRRLLVIYGKRGFPELPGGGWEHGETLEACLQRELQEEIGVRAKTISPIRFTFQAQTIRGWYALRLVVEVQLESLDFTFGDGMTAAKFVTKEEFLRLSYDDPADAAITACAEQIWN